MNYRKTISTLLFSLMVATGGVGRSQEVSEPFQSLNRNKDGKLTKDEFSGPLFDRIDTNNDGIVTADEDRAFVRILRTLPQEAFDLTVNHSEGGPISLRTLLERITNDIPHHIQFITEK